jgi:glycosyltransferase involved in cell wall biosynthesis
MKIVYLLTSLGIGGAERQVVALAEGLAARGHGVTLLVLRPRLKQEWPTHLDVVSLGVSKTPLRVWRALIRGRRFLADLRPDLIHSHSFHANVVARLLVLFLRPAVVISTVHNVFEGGWQRMLAYRLTDRLSQRTTAVSHATADRFIRLKAVSRERCLVVSNAFEPADFLPQPERRTKTRAEMQLSDSSFVWLAAGRVVPAKDYPNLLRAFAAVHLAQPNAKLWIAGEYTPAAIAPLRLLASELQLGDGLLWLGLRRDIAALLGAADGFVQASAWEGMPLAIGEAMCVEKPVVATNVGGVRELVGDTGVVVEPRDSDALAKAMLAEMNTPEQDRKLRGSAARLRIEQEFSMEKRIVEWETLYRDVLGELPETNNS